MAQNDLVKGLTDLGYRATDSSKDAITKGLDTVDRLSGGTVLKRVSETGRGVMYEMNAGVAKGILKGLTGKQ